MTEKKLEQVIAKIRELGGRWSMTVEYPGCIAVNVPQQGGSWWWGTANDCWGAGFVFGNGKDGDDFIQTSLSSDCGDPDTVGQTIYDEMRQRLEESDDEGEPLEDLDEYDGDL